MNSRKMFPWMVFQDREDDLASSGGGDQQTLDTDQEQTTDQQQNHSPTGTESPFAGIAGLEGLSPQEAALKLRALEATVRGQGRALNDAARRGPPVVEAPHAPDPDIDATTFFAEPGKALKQMEERIANRLTRDMQEIISPFREDLAKTREAQAWQAVRERYADLDTYKDYIQTQLDQRGIKDPTAGTIRLLYLDAKDSLGMETPPAAPANSSGRPAPPQHPASRQPISAGQTGNKPIRQLTESERTVMRMQGFKSEKEYLDWLDINEEDVTSSDIGVKQ